MKLILENWRKFLKEEQWYIHPKIERQIQNLLALPSDIIIDIQELESEWYKIKYINEKKLGEPRGSIEIVKADNEDSEGQCLGGYIVYMSSASKGWGPLLYEVAIEFASVISHGLTPDRGEVSSMATSVWDRYAKRSDVTKKQLDIAHGDHRIHTLKVAFPEEDYRMVSPNDIEQLTPEYEYDDCDQRMALKHAGYKWADASHAKLYSKREMPVLKLLKAAKRLKLPK
tara:strand:- start:599 stop:1282 length:684 start_codon:yes stop_codon:yes gene_type:complete